jgi:hypothetical protein
VDEDHVEERDDLSFSDGAIRFGGIAAVLGAALLWPTRPGRLPRPIHVRDTEPARRRRRRRP